ncbi:hypothetical protein SLS58_003697 [Diplodia intermedia]|uniref:Amidoligase enzyme n=1 Tax=Diplodia intermedia TaxID=856260 RepID=A0ABR3TVX7_9PEZI
MAQVSPDPAAPAAPDLTFGIELEFMLIGNKHEMLNYLMSPGDTGWYDIARVLVRQVLASNGIPMYECEDLFAAAFGDDQPPIAQRYQKWAVSPDNSVSLTEAEQRLLPDGYMSDCVELKSRIFSLRNEHEWRTEIAHVLATLHRTLNSSTTGICPSVRIFTNETCALHVHVGRSADASRVFTLRTLQNLFQLATGFERVIDELHSADRIKNLPPSSGPGGGLFGETLSIIAPPSAHWRGHPDPAVAQGSALDWCAAIDAPFVAPAREESASISLAAADRDDSDDSDDGPPTPLSPGRISHLALRRMTSSSRLVAYNLCNALIIGYGPPFDPVCPPSNHDNNNVLDDDEERGGSTTMHRRGRVDREWSFYTWTVEFRQHRGTLEAAAVSAWVDVVTRMAGVAERAADAGAAGTDTLRGLLLARVADPAFGARRWLTDTLGVARETVAFYDAQWRRREADVDAVDTRAGAGAAAGVYPAAVLLWRNALETAELRSRRRVLVTVRRKLEDGQYGRFDRSVWRELARGMTDELMAINLNH